MESGSRNPAFQIPSPVATGNVLVLMRDKVKTTSVVKKLKEKAKLNLAVSKDFADSTKALTESFASGDGLYLENLKVAVIKRNGNADTHALASAMAGDGDFVSTRPEFYMYAYSHLQQRYQQWVRDGLHLLADGMPGTGGFTGAGASIAKAVTEDPDPDLTWGVKAINAHLSGYSGKGIKLAVLDTGFDLEHPDFVGREITTRSFVPNEEVQDLQGHGTHCIGTSAGPLAGAEHARYGVAHEAHIHVGKVLDNGGSGAESWIIAGMDWAIGEGCEVISMSLGRATSVGEPPDPIYEQVGQIALENGSLIIAAAGNESARQFNFIAPVGAPANSPSIMAVAAVDSDMAIADFSSGGINDQGGEINISGPGVAVFSSFPMPERYKKLSGTSMATPHVAGVAALLAESDPDLRGQKLWEALRRGAADIGLPIRDGGAGLVQSPVPSYGKVPVA